MTMHVKLSVAGAVMTAVCTAEGVFTFGVGVYGRLGHGGEEDEIVPRLVEALAGKKVIARLVQRQVRVTQPCGPRWGGSSHLGMECLLGYFQAGPVARRASKGACAEEDRCFRGSMKRRVVRIAWRHACTGNCNINVVADARSDMRTRVRGLISSVPKGGARVSVFMAGLPRVACYPAAQLARTTAK